eukprot:EG_transcript_11655
MKVDGRVAAFGAAAALECLLVPLIILKVPYTEIDWRAYMQEVEAILGGEMNYKNVRGDTGPIVYPAGFVYVYSALYYLTGSGNNIALAQQLFGVLYLVFIATVLYIYSKVKGVPSWALLLLCLSRRIHSIFVLRLFNDCVAMLFLYLAVACLLRNRWALGCVVYSLAVSVKMNVLLFAPGLFFLLLQRFGVAGTVWKLGICAAVQVVLGLPFLCTYPVEYLSRAFELSRVFFHVWSVNLKFLPEEVFQSKALALVLLALHLASIFLFAHFRWCRHSGGLVGVFRSRGGQQPSPNHIVATLLEANFLGIVFARTLHYQFYVWYYHSLVFLLWVGCRRVDRAGLRLAEWLGNGASAQAVGAVAPHGLRLLALGLIEVVWNVYPSRPATALLLTALHLGLLHELARSPPAPAGDGGPPTLAQAPDRRPAPVSHDSRDRWAAGHQRGPTAPTLRKARPS